jgi:hypothetical protein
MADNPIDTGLGTAPATSPAQTSPTNPIDAGLSGSSFSAPAPVSSDVNPIDSGLSGAPKVSKSPDNGQADSGQSFIGKAWDWANTPLINLNKDNQSGFIGGAEDVLSGLTSPLSIGLTLATFGGGAALRGLGLAAEEMPVALRGAQALLKAGQAADGSAEAITALRTAGMAEREIPTAMKGANALFKAGVNADYIPHMNSLVKSSPDLMNALSEVGIKQEAFPTAIRGVKSLIDAGFTAQAAMQVIKESPEVLDAMKEGRYDDAARLATHVAAGGVLGVLGAHEFGNDFAKTWEDAQIAAGGKVKLSETNRLLRLNEGERIRLVEEGKDQAKTYNTNVRRIYDKVDKLHASAAGDLMRAGIDDPQAVSTLIDRHNEFADAAGKPEERVPGGMPKFSLGDAEPNEKLPPALQGFGIKYPILKDGQKIGTLDIIKNGDTATINWVGAEGDTPTGPLGRGELSNQFGVNGVRNLVRQFVEKNPEIKTIEGQRIGGRGGAGGDVLNPVSVPIEKILPSNSTSQSRIEEVIGQQNVKKNYTPEEIKFKLDSYKEAIKSIQDRDSDPVYGQMTEMAKMHRKALDELLDVAKSHGFIKEGIDNYLTNSWKPEDLNTPQNNLLRDEANSNRFMTNISMARHRIFENSHEGELLGRKLLTNDPTTLTSNYIDKMTEAIANKKFLDRVFDVKASDGRPLAALAGSGHTVTDKVTGKPIVLDNPDVMKNINISDDKIAQLKKNGLFDRFLANDTIIKTSHEREDYYAWNTHDYRDINANALTDWAFGARLPDGAKTMIKSRYKVHPEGVEYLTKLLGAEESPLRQMKPLNFLLKVSSEAKHMMLSFSPFHIAQEGLRAMMTGISPIEWHHLDINDHPDLKLGVEEGLTRGTHYNSLSKYESGLEEGLGGRSKTLDAIGKLGDKLGVVGKPLSILRDIQNGTTNFLFERYIPGLKDRAFKELNQRWTDKLQDDKFFNRLQQNHPEFEGYTKERAAARLAAEETNERFGGLNYRMMGRSMGTQDFLRLTTLAPDWLESELRSVKRILDPTEGTMLRRDTVRMAAIMYGTARVLNMLISGKLHNEAPFGVAYTDKDGKEKVYSIRTLPTDMFHAATDPVGFMRGRMSPLVRTTAEAYTGRDFQGRKLTPGDTAVDIIRNNFVPIPAQAVIKGATGGSPDLTTPDQAVKALGATAQVYRTEAQKLANTLSSNKNETGPVEESQLRKHRAVIDLENKIRSGQAPLSTLNDLVENGHLSQKDAKIVHKNVQETHGMDPEMAQLYSQAARLPTPDFLKIWDAATPNEQSVLAKLLIKKRTAYNSKVLKEMTPAQRTADPTYNRLKTMFPGQMVF